MYIDEVFLKAFFRPLLTGELKPEVEAQRSQARWARTAVVSGQQQTHFRSQTDTRGEWA